jgi:aminobenzoyl-glutamate utilization protein B
MMKQEIYKQVESMRGLFDEISQNLWEHPETGGNEKNSANCFRELLEKESFRIKNVPELPHAFCAEYGSGSPVIAILGEYDALPGLSQKCVAVKAYAEAGGAGHGCGHNLLGTAGFLAALSIKKMIDQGEITGTIRFYGCPEEELLSGKVKMAYYHMFDGCDAAMSWHPMSANMVYDSAYLANASVRYFFKGKTAHAAFAPELGRSALDAVELMNIGANYLREHVIDKARIHYTTDSGGFSPNIVPDKANAWYFVRAPYMSDVKEILGRLEKIAQGAALMTETEVEIQVDCGCCEMKENKAFADLSYENLLEAGVIEYTKEELSFAKELQSTLDPKLLKRDQNAYKETAPMHTGISERHLCDSVGLYSSSDSGDVSQMMPMNLITTACWPIGCAPHTWQTTAAAGHSIGKKGGLHAAKVITGIAYDLFTKPDVLDKIKEEYQASKAHYMPMYQEN